MQAQSMRILLAIIFFGATIPSGFAQPGIITTYVGPKLPADGGWATISDIGQVSSVAPDGAGGFYFFSPSRPRVYRVTADGRVHFFAGNGIKGESGDYAPATSAQIRGGRLAVDGAGNLYIDEWLTIRKVTPDGLISTVPEGSIDGETVTSAGSCGIAANSAGDLFISDCFNYRIRKLTKDGLVSTVAGNGTQGFSGDGGPATSAQINFPFALAADSAGNLFIAEDTRIRRVDSKGIISTVAGTGTQGYTGDGGPATSAQIGGSRSLAVDLVGNLFIAQRTAVRKVTVAGLISTVAGKDTAGFSGDGGPATSAQLYDPESIAVDAAGNLFIADRENQRVRKVDPYGIISTVAGNGTQGFSGDGGPATSAQLSNPLGIAMDTASNLFIVDNGNSRIRKVTPDGLISTVAGNGIKGFSGDGGPATSAQFYGLEGIAVDIAGNLFITDTYNFRIRKITPNGQISTVAGGGISSYNGDGGPATSALLYWPTGIAVDSVGNLFIAEMGRHRIRKVTPAGVISTIAGNGTSGFSGDGGPATLAQFHYPRGIAVDMAGNLFIADYYNARVRKVAPGGGISTVAGDGTQGFGGNGGPAVSAQLNYPFDVAVDVAGNLYIADEMNSQIRKVTPDGLISTVAGSGEQGFSGDGGPATSAALYPPRGVAVDPAGNLFISDTENARIRKVASIAACSGLTLKSGGAAMCRTTESSPTIRAGYAKVTVNSGTAPYAVAVLRSKQDEVTVTEAGVPASPPTTKARIFIDYRAAVNPVPARSDAGRVDVNTGIAVQNSGSSTANVTYTLRAPDGEIRATGHGIIGAGKHFAKFIGQLKDVASDFDLPSVFQSSIQFGSLEVTSDQPVSVLGLRGTLNQRNEFLLTTTPVADLTKSLDNNSIYFPQLADGGGYTTSLFLLNTSNSIESGTLHIIDSNGAPLVVNQVGGTADSSFRYSIPVGGVFRFQTDGFSETTKTGWAKLIPDSFSPAPISSAAYGYNPSGVLVFESGIPASTPTTHARIYVDLSGHHNTGLAIANVGSIAANIAVKAYQADGLTAVGSSQDLLQLVAGAHAAKFADELISGLPAGFSGVLDISSKSPFAALTLRSLINERNEFLMTAFPVADISQAAPSPILFPLIADGGGYLTEFILMSAGPAASTKISYFDEDGAATGF